MNSKKIFTEEEFKDEVLHSRKPVLVEYASTWSGACHIMRPVINNLIKEYNGRIKFCLIDCDKENSIAKFYGVLQLPTFQFFLHGQVIEHIYGALSRKELSENLNLLLEKLEKTNRQ